MGRAPCCDKANVKKGPWSPEEDAKLKEYIEKYGTGGNWIALPQKAGLRRCGKSCRLRWLNYLRPNIKHGEFSDDEDKIICTLFASIGSRWSIIAAQLPGRTDNDIKNYWNTKLKKKLMGMTPSSMKRPNYPSLSFLQTPPSFSYSAPSSRCCNDTYYTNPTTTSFTAYHDQPTIPSNLLNTTTTNTITQAYQVVVPTQETYVGPMHNFQVMFGNDQASCSSNSDGSWNNNNNNNNNQISHGREVVDQYGGCFYNGVDGNANGLVYDYGLEEIKQLISSTTNVCNNFNVFVDESKTDEEEEKVMYY